MVPNKVFLRKYQPSIVPYFFGLFFLGRELFPGTKTWYCGVCRPLLDSHDWLVSSPQKKVSPPFHEKRITSIGELAAAALQKREKINPSESSYRNAGAFWRFERKIRTAKGVEKLSQDWAGYFWRDNSNKKLDFTWETRNLKVENTSYEPFLLQTY